MTAASRLSPKVRFAVQCRIRVDFRIENAVAVRLAKSMRKLPAASYADSCVPVHYDNDVTPGFHHDEADGAALNVHDITGAAHAKVTQCIKCSKPSSGFNEDLSKFEGLACMPSQGGHVQSGRAPEAPELEPPAAKNGQLPTTQEEGRDAHDSDEAAALETVPTPKKCKWSCWL